MNFPHNIFFPKKQACHNIKSIIHTVNSGLQQINIGYGSSFYIGIYIHVHTIPHFPVKITCPVDQVEKK